MIIRIDFSADEPIYQQIRNQVVKAVASGELQAGDVLPSVRSLAVDLGVNMHTVNKAYAVLRDEGYVTMRGRSGARIANRTQELHPEQAAQVRGRLAEALDRLLVEHKANGGTAEEFLALAAQEASAVYGDPLEASPSEAFASKLLTSSGSLHARSSVASDFERDIAR